MNHITPAELAAVAERHPEIAQDELEIDDEREIDE